MGILKASIISLVQIFFFISFANSDENRLKLIDEVLSVLREHYVQNINNSEFEQSAAKCLVSSLDPHSSYIDKNQLQQVKDMMNSSYTGIGIEILNSNGKTVIVDILPNSPAAKAGLKEKDIIVEANGKKLVGMSIQEIRDILIGKPGTLLNLLIMRQNTELEFKIYREKINIKSNIVKLIDNDEVAYIRIRNFSHKVSEQVKTSYKELNKSLLKGVIIDLRSNPGGLLEEAVNVSGLFIPNGMKIVAIQSRNEKVSQEFFSDGEDITNGLPIVIIINAISASAAEIVAGALQDHKRAQVLGMQSFGKGSVQTTLPLSNGSAIKLTTALYYTPNGNIIQNNGVMPNIIVEDGMVVNEITFSNALSEKKLKNNLPENLFNKKESDDQTIRLYNRKILGDISADFQLIRAIDVIQTMSYYKSLNSIK
jgi:carboxyl-terminal processing protease